MITLKVTLLFVAAIANILVALIVLARDFRKLNALAFFTLLFTVGGWAAGIGGFLLANSSALALLWAKIFYAFPILIGLALVFFVHSFPSASFREVPAKWRWLAITAALINFIPLVFVSRYLTESVRYHSWGKEIVLGAGPYLIYTIYILGTFSSSLWVIYKKIHKLHGLYTEQARLFALSFLIASGFGVVFNLILPGLGNYRLIWLGPLFTGVLTIGIAISIIRHKMFDIRLAVARSLGYAVSLFVLAGAYGLIVLTVTQFIFNLNLTLGAEIFLSVATGIVGLAFYPLRKKFDKATNSVFYRDAYDPQELFGQLNKLLVSSLDIRYLLHQSSVIIASNLKSELCVIGLRDGDTGQRIFGTQKVTFDPKDIAHVRKLTPEIHQTVIAIDYLDERHTELREILQANKLSVLIRLSPNVRVTEEGLGYIALGPKKSGNPYSEHDIRVLDTVAKELIIAVQNALRFEEIRNFNDTLQQKVAEATKELRRNNEKLRALDETKDDFISMASHQLRTPLTSVKGYISLVLEGDAGNISEQQRKLLNQAFISSQRMVYLISDLLNVSRLKTGKFIIEPAPVNLADVIDDEITQLVETARSRTIELKYEKPKDFPTLMLDETKTRQVVMNFVDNAIYYTPENGHITVELIDKPSTVELRVVDDGIGVPKNEQHHLFTKFYRAQNARKARPDGTGLGLFMAKKVIAGQGGAIIFESTEGKGSTFGFTFSKTKLAAKPANAPATSETAIAK